MLTEINIERLPSFSFERGEEMVWKMLWKDDMISWKFPSCLVLQWKAWGTHRRKGRRWSGV